MALLGHLMGMALLVEAELVSHYTFDDPESPGMDLGSFANHGTFEGSAAITGDARIGSGSLELNGSADYVSLGGGNDFSSLDDDGDGFTLAAWVKPSSLGGVRRIFSRAMFSGFSGTGWGAGMSGGSLFATHYGRFDFNADSNDLVTGVWSHVAYVFRPAAGEIRFYVDGVLVATKS